MKLAQAAIERLSRALALVGGVCVVLMMMHVTADSASKYFLKLPIEGTLEIVSQYYMVACVFLPLALVELRGEQVRVDLFVRLVAPRAAYACYVVTAILTGVFFASLAYYTGKEAIRSFQINEVMMGTSYVVIWPSKWLLPISFGVVALAVAFRLLQALLYPRKFNPVSLKHEHDIS